MSWPTAIAALRVRHWLHFIPLPLASMAVLSPARIALACAAAAASLAFAWGINSVADRIGDDATKNPLAGRVRIGRELLITLTALVLAALGLAALLGFEAVIAVSLSLLAGAAYSAGPRLKRWPGAGLVANTLIFVPLLALGIDAHVVHPNFPTLLIVFTALLLQNQLVHELGDAAEDERSGTLTTARTLGPRLTLGLVVAFGLAGALAVREPWPALAIAACTLVPFLPARTPSGGGAAVLVNAWSRTRVAHRVAALLAGAALFLAGRLP